MRRRTRSTSTCCGATERSPNATSTRSAAPAATIACGPRGLSNLRPVGRFKNSHLHAVAPQPDRLQRVALGGSRWGAPATAALVESRLPTIEVGGWYPKAIPGLSGCRGSCPSRRRSPAPRVAFRVITTRRGMVARFRCEKRKPAATPEKARPSPTGGAIVGHDVVRRTWQAPRSVPRRGKSIAFEG